MDLEDDLPRSIQMTLKGAPWRDGFILSLPAGTPVAHKTGSITKIEHDAGIVYVPGRKPYVLVVLVRGIAEEARAHKLIADISRAVYEDLGKTR